MTSSIPIPTSRNNNKTTNPPTHHHHHHHRSSLSSHYSPSTPGSSYASSSTSFPSFAGGADAYSLSSKGKGKGKEREDNGLLRERQPRRESLLGTSLSKSEHTVVDLGCGGAPRLVSCVKSSQGFDWNQELFLPSYAEYESQDLERKQDPVEDIVLTDEEVAAMFPQ